jgi:hypothetical protein
METGGVIYETCTPASSLLIVHVHSLPSVIDRARFGLFYVPCCTYILRVDRKTMLQGMFPMHSISAYYSGERE